ncbi:hypothetical protein BJY04DRAFT_226281 [Aspergillus karnatakaensis]|uniref:TMEM53 family protein n=1 Tax=Aspergillus karnatakaensis TaxID=1810916 RepID=UPI003CCE2050
MPHPLFLSPFPGFSPLSNRIFYRNGDANPAPSTEHPATTIPTTILLFAWGDALPKHITKYITGYQSLFPSSRIIVILSKTLHASTQSPEARVRAMTPIIDLLFPIPSTSLSASGSGSGSVSTPEQNTIQKKSKDGPKERILLHAMSNTGAIYAASTLLAYQARHGATNPLPHRLFVCDSLPGGVNFRSQVTCWARAMALGTSSSLPLPLPLLFLQSIWYIFLCMVFIYEKLRGFEAAGMFATGVMSDPALASKDARRVYIYSREDEIVRWEDVEGFAAGARRVGYEVQMEVFSGSMHVGHMRVDPERYWGVILRAWRASSGIVGG